MQSSPWLEKASRLESKCSRGVGGGREIVFILDSIGWSRRFHQVSFPSQLVLLVKWGEIGERVCECRYVSVGWTV